MLRADRLIALGFILGLAATPAAAQTRTYPQSQQMPQATGSNSPSDDSRSGLRTVSDSFRLWMLWGSVATLGAVLAFGIRWYLKLTAHSDPNASVMNDAWVQARLRGETPPPPVGLETEPESSPPTADCSNPQSVSNGRPWQRPNQVRTQRLSE